MEAGVREQLGQIDRLLSDGHPLSALRALAALTRRLAQGLSLAEVQPPGAGKDPDRDTLYGRLTRIQERLARRGSCWATVPSLLRQVDQLGALGAPVAHRLGELRDLLETRLGAPADAGVKAIAHFVAMFTLDELEVGIASPVTWHAVAAEHDLSQPSFDEKGHEQIAAAKGVLLGLVDGDEVVGVHGLNERRRLVTLAALTLDDWVKGESLGLPALLALVATHLSLVPAVPTAATGAIAWTAVPGLAGGVHRDAQALRRFLEVPVERVGGIALKVRAVLDHHPEVRLILLPKGNEAEVIADRELDEDLESRCTQVRYIGRVGDLFDGEDLYSRRVQGAPLCALHTKWAVEDVRDLFRRANVLIGVCEVAVLLLLVVIVGAF